MTACILTSASFRQDASAQALVRTLDPRDPDLALDVHHQLVWSLFAETAGEDGERDFLWRYDDGRFRILSLAEPQDSHRLFEMDVRRLDLQFEPGERLAFRLRANATVSRANGGGGRRSPRHDVVMDALLRLQAERPPLTRAEAREAVVPEASEKWLRRTGERAGFEVERLVDVSYRTVQLRRRPDQGRSRDDERKEPVRNGRVPPARFGVIDVDGFVVVREPDVFAGAVIRGFGRAKAFGFGLMLLDKV